MNAIKRRNRILLTFISLSILMGVWLLLYKEGFLDPRVQLLAAGIITAGGVAAVFLLQGRSRLKIARVIAENPILHIDTAIISDISAGTPRQSAAQHSEIIISYFGILLDEKIIKFNQDGIRLRTVEIGRDFISFTYGTKGQTQSIRLLHPALNAAELAEIIEKFRYETGITPVVVNEGRRKI